MSKKLTAPVQIMLAGMIATSANLISIPPESLAAPTQHQFLMEMHSHRSLVRIVGLFIMNKRPELFSKIDESLAAQYLELHDLPKVMPLEQLQLFGGAQSATIGQRLLAFYGKRRENMTSEEFKTLMATTSDLNRIEDMIKNSFFEKHSVRSHQKGELLFLEELADFAVTELSRQTELPGFNAVMILEQKGETDEADVLSEMLPEIRAYLESRKDCQHLLTANGPH